MDMELTILKSERFSKLKITWHKSSPSKEVPLITPITSILSIIDGKY